MQSRASLLVLLLSVVDRLLADDADISVAELHNIWDAFSRRVSAWAQTALEDLDTQTIPSAAPPTASGFGPTSAPAAQASASMRPRDVSSGASREVLAFDFGAIDIILSVFRERSEDFQAQIVAGCELMLRLFVAIVKHDEQQDGVSSLSLQAGALLGAFSALLPPSSCDKVALSFKTSPLFQTSGADVGGEDLQHDPEPGLAFLCCLTVAALKRHTQDPAEPQSQPSSDLTSCVANIISILAAGLDDEGRDWWTPALIKFVLSNSAAPLVAGGDVVALKVLGGNIKSLSLGTEVELKDGLSGVIVHDAPPPAAKEPKMGFAKESPVSQQEPENVFVTLPDGSVLRTMASCPLKSPYIGRLNPKTMDLLMKYVQASRPTLLSVVGIDAPPAFGSTGGGVEGQKAAPLAFGSPGAAIGTSNAGGFGAPAFGGGRAFGASTGGAFGQPAAFGSFGSSTGSSFGQPPAGGFGASTGGAVSQPAGSTGAAFGGTTSGGSSFASSAPQASPSTGAALSGATLALSFGSPSPSALFGTSHTPIDTGNGAGSTAACAADCAVVAADDMASSTSAAPGQGLRFSFAPSSGLTLKASQPVFGKLSGIGRQTPQSVPYHHQGSAPGATVAGSSEDVAIKADLMKRELRIIKALVEHSGCYDGFGEENVGEFATMGEKEIATILDQTTFNDNKILASLMKLGLSAGQLENFRWAVRALEDCVIALENKKENANLSTFGGADKFRTLAAPGKKEGSSVSPNTRFALVLQVQVLQCIIECMRAYTRSHAYQHTRTCTFINAEKPVFDLSRRRLVLSCIAW